MKKKNARTRISRTSIQDLESVQPMQALQFLEDIRVLYSSKDEPTQAISLRIPANVLRLLKTRAASEGKKYQSLIIQILRESLKPL